MSLTDKYTNSPILSSERHSIISIIAAGTNQFLVLHSLLMFVDLVKTVIIASGYRYLYC